MREIPSTEAKDKWGALTDTALQGPVAITRRGRPSLVLTSIQDYQALQQLKFERLRDDVQAGFRSLERGEYSAKSMDDLKREARSRYEQLKNDGPR